MNPMDTFSSRRPLIEPLEQRIAPALLVSGANLLGGAGNAKTGETSIGGNEVTLVKVLSGEAIVWVGYSGISAISVGPNTSLDLTGDVPLIIGNLTASGQLSNSNPTAANGLNGDVLLPNDITGITTHPLGDELGSIGTIITGGSITNLNISGALGSYGGAALTYEGGVFAGDGAFHAGSQVLSGGSVTVDVGVDVNPIAPGFQGSFTFTPATASTLSGASITNIKMGDAEQLQMFAGNGAAGTAASHGHAATAGQPGGSISKITIANAFITLGLPATTPSYNLVAGSGGAGTKGGAGGSISGIDEVSSNGVVDITAGQGGAAASGPGGAGGSITGLNMESVSSAYTIHAGKGGAGAPGGAGGSVKGVNFGGNQLSNGIIVAAPWTGGSVDDILLVDSLTGNMVIEQNDGDGTGFTPKVQDNITNLTTIAPEGATPVGAVAFYLPGGTLPNIAVAYKDSTSVGIYLNQGHGVFYTQDFSSGTYIGDTLDGTSVPLPYAPSQIAVGNFTGDGSQDLAVLAANGGQTELLTLAGTATGQFSLLTSFVSLPTGPVSLITADIQGGQYNDLFVGFKTGLIDAFLSTGSTNGAPFTLEATGITVAGGIANLDYNPQEGLLMALSGTGSTMNFYESQSSGALIQVASVALTQQPGTALVAHFVPETQSAAEPVEVLSSVGGGSRIDVYTQELSSFVLTSSTSSTEGLKNFVPVIEGSTSGVAAVGGSLEHFAFSQNGSPFFDTSLPFSGKKVNLFAGDGGAGYTSVGTSAAGGAGGEIFGMNILAGDITLLSGAGGSSINAAAGAGGIIKDTPTLAILTGQVIPTVIESDYVLTISTGNGGSASGSNHSAIGGAGGAIDSLNFSLETGDILINSGSGGTGGGGAGGNGGQVMGLKSLNTGGDLDITAGNGGGAAGAVGNGGAGGSIMDITHTLTPSDLLTEAPYNVNLFAGAGGSSFAALGGAGGSVEEVTMTLQPANESANNPEASPATSHINIDSTVRVTVDAGNGGSGTVGGAGGSINKIQGTIVYDQTIIIIGATAADDSDIPEINPVAAVFTAGNGGTGTKSAGGIGGSVSNLSLAGISHYDTDPADPQAGQSPLVIIAGNGGGGVTVGGAGGAVSSVSAINSHFITLSGSVDNLSVTELSGATITSGTGGTATTGNGGAGGDVSGLNVAVIGFPQDNHLYVPNSNFQLAGGNLTVKTGAGGASGTAGKGGAGGSITNSMVGSADTFEAYGILLQAGPGGSGALGGGAGGGVSGIQVNGPQESFDYIDNCDALSTIILAGNGGAATGSAATGGLGGSISQIFETKDVNSAINLIQAGNGGGAVATGGLGGSVSTVKTAGLIGAASDQFGRSFGAFFTATDAPALTSLFPAGVPEGVFAGAGGSGGTAGLAGSVTSINAYAISAIGAAMNPTTGIFAAAEKVANITAAAIGFSAEDLTTYQGVSPGNAAPTDGFIFSVHAPTAIIGDVLAGSEFHS